MSKRMIITTAVLSCLLCTSCTAAEKAEIPDLKGDMNISGRVAATALRHRRSLPEVQVYGPYALLRLTA